MGQATIAQWAAIIIISVYFLYLAFLSATHRPLKTRIIVWGMVGFAILSLLQIGIQAYIYNGQLEAEQGPNKYLSVRYSDFVYSLGWRSVMQLGYNVLFGFTVGAVFYFLHRASKGLLLDTQDILLIGFSAMITGWPNFLITTALIFIVTIFLKILFVVFHKEKLSERIIVTPAIPWALLVMFFFGNFLAQAVGLYALR